MRSTFLGFNTATSGLFAAQRALDITGHNISNVNTPGYTRQRLEQTQANALRLAGGTGTLGTGVTSVAIHQLRNEFLDFRYRDEVNAQGFTSQYAPANWTIELPESQYGGSIDFDANTLVINGPDGNSCDFEEVSVSIIIPKSGTVSFDWEFVNQDIDPDYDFFIKQTCTQGNETELYRTTDNETGTFSHHFSEGERLSLVVLSTDCVLGRGIATITNFSAPLLLINVFKLNIETVGSR